MDAPAMLTHKQVPEDVGLHSTGADESAAGGQGQLHRDEKEHKPVLKKVKEKVKKFKHTLAGHSHGHGDEHGQRDERAEDDASSGDDDEEGDAALEREAAMEKGGYMEDVEDKPVAMETNPEVHGAPMYDSEMPPAVREAYGADAPGVRFGDLGGAAAHDPTAREARREDFPKVRLGDLGGPVVEDPAAPRSTTPAAREGEDIGTTPVVREFESMTLSDNLAHVGAGKKGAKAEEWKDAAADKIGGPTYTDKLKNVAAVPAEYGKKLTTTVYETVAGGVGAGKRDEERVSDAGGEEWKDAPTAVDETTDRSYGPGYADKIKSTAAGTTEYGKKLASAAYDKVAGVGAAVTPSLRPQVDAVKPEEGRKDAMPMSDVGTERTEVAATDGTCSASGPGYTDKIKSAIVGTTEHGKQLASTLYEKVAGVGTAVVGKVHQATHSTGAASPGVGAHQQGTTASTLTPGGAGNGQDKGVTVTGYIVEKLRPSEDDRALSSAISGAVQRRKEGVRGTVGQRVPAPSQASTKAREAVTTLTGGNRVSEAVQSNAATGADVKEDVGAEAPVLRGEEIGEPKLNTNTM